MDMIKIHMPKNKKENVIMTVAQLCERHFGEVFLSSPNGGLFLVTDMGLTILSNPGSTWSKNTEGEIVFTIDHFVDLEINVKEKGE